MECNLEENIPLEIVFSDQITQDKPGAGSAHQDKFIFYETWPCLCVSLHCSQRHNQHISRHCTLQLQESDRFNLLTNNLEHLTQHWQWQSQTRWQQQHQHSQIGSQQQLQGCGQKGSFKLCHHNYCQNAKPKFATTKSFFFLLRSSLTRDTESLQTQNWNI